MSLRPTLRELRRSVGAAAGLAAILTMSMATPGLAAQTIGGDLLPGSWLKNPCNSAPSCTLMQLTGSTLPLSPNTNGVIVRWRVRTTNEGPYYANRLQVLRPTGSGNYTVVNQSAPEFFLSGVDHRPTFRTYYQPIAPGDRIGLKLDHPSDLWIIGGGAPATSDWAIGRFDPALEVGATSAPTRTWEGFEALFNADVEPDADCDGLGDETQDREVTGGCLPFKLAQLHRRGARVRGRTLSLGVTCAPSGQACLDNTLAVHLAGPAAGSATLSRKGRRLIGFARFSTPAGISKRVSVTLNKRGARMLRRPKHRRVIVTIQGQQGTETATLGVRVNTK